MKEFLNNIADKALVPLGFAFHLVLLFNFSWPGNLDVLEFSSNYTFIYARYELTQYIAVGITFLLWSINAWLRPVPKKLIFSISISTVTITGFVFLNAALFLDKPEALSVLAGIFLGTGLSSGVMTWMRVFSTRDFYYSSTRIVFALGLAAILDTILQILPDVWNWWLLMAMAVISCLSGPFCINAQDYSGPAFNHKPADNKSRYLKQAKNLWRPCLYAAATAFIWGLLRVYMVHSEYSPQSNFCLDLGLAFATITLAFLWIFFNNKYGFLRAFKTLLPVLVASLAGVFLVGKAALPITFTFFSYGIGLAWLLMFLICARDAQNKEAHPFVIWGVFASIYSVSSSLLGYTIGYETLIACSDYFAIPQNLLISALCLLVLFAILYIDNLKSHSYALKKHKINTQKFLDDILSEKCDKKAKERGLTPRERDVMGLLVKGRDVYHISEDLFISVNTVQFHCKNIYKKMKVHSKQELIEAVNECKL
ncbi:LuxR family transcriptional regulator [Adlercreutzia sp. ZJ154]|uniref:LuxR family transcriptional regulator n=1 Tax=Adlercreutzia sp. ZJ154 TaxID=2709790 RepID=UPI00197CF9BB|nr:LuxR family transcriptional regulator [Adlercreutzia sp. ZJ154]